MNCRYCGASGAEAGVGDDGLCIDAYKCEERHDMQVQEPVVDLVGALRKSIDAARERRLAEQVEP